MDQELKHFTWPAHYVTLFKSLGEFQTKTGTIGNNNNNTTYSEQQPHTLHATSLTTLDQRRKNKSKKKQKKKSKNPSEPQSGFSLMKMHIKYLL